jgi:hypothetical protein
VGQRERGAPTIAQNAFIGKLLNSALRQAGSLRKFSGGKFALAWGDGLSRAGDRFRVFLHGSIIICEIISRKLFATSD